MNVCCLAYVADLAGENLLFDAALSNIPNLKWSTQSI